LSKTAILNVYNILLVSLCGFISLLSYYAYIRPCYYLLVITGQAYGRLIDDSSTFRNTGDKQYFHFRYDNDYFAKSDEYYTQGITCEPVHSGVKRFPLSKLLWKPFAGIPVYGASLNLFCHTPTTILSDSILQRLPGISFSFVPGANSEAR
jgi:hypothetical protein